VSLKSLQNLQGILVLFPCFMKEIFRLDFEEDFAKNFENFKSDFWISAGVFTRSCKGFL
jgi:hypothetical protein